MRKIVGAFAVAGALLAAAPAFADDAKPSEIARVIKADEPYGTGSLRVLLMKAYDASLWTDASQWSMQSPFALTLKYHFNCSASDIVDRAVDEISHTSNLSAATIAHYRSLIATLLPGARSGDEMTGLYTPDGTVRFYVNGQKTGQVKDPAFAQAFFGMWLSPQTSEPDIRAGLLHLDT
jgi:hypothetical protein